jgi:membrane-associated phospholipid phosphatase
MTVMANLSEIDKRLLKWLYRRRFNHPYVLKTLIFVGDGPFWMAVMFVCALTGQMAGNETLNRLAVLLMCGFALSNLMFVPSKTYVKRLRPYADHELQQYLGIVIENRDPGHGSRENESFPSGHVLWTTLAVTFICYQYGYPAVILTGWLVPVMMCLRPHLGVHYPSDVLAGLVIGSINAAAVIAVTPRLMTFISSMQKNSGFIYGYWMFIGMFLIVGFKSWLKRV